MDPSTQKALRSIEENRSLLTEAEISVGAGAYRAAITSVYLAFFHYARAILINDGCREKSHYCIGVYLEECSKKDLLEPKWPTIFNSIKNIRNTGQYSFDIHPDRTEVLKHIPDVMGFIDRMEQLPGK